MEKEYMERVCTAKVCREMACKVIAWMMTWCIGKPRRLVIGDPRLQSLQMARIPWTHPGFSLPADCNEIGRRGEIPFSSMAL